MWGNLNNVRSMAAKIGNVVAPPPEEYESDEEEYEDEDDEYEDEEYTEEEEEKVQPRSPFGLVSMLTQAMTDSDPTTEETVNFLHDRAESYVDDRALSDQVIEEVNEEPSESERPGEEDDGDPAPLTPSEQRFDSQSAPKSPQAEGLPPSPARQPSENRFGMEVALSKAEGESPKAQESPKAEESTKAKEAQEAPKVQEAPNEDDIVVASPDRVSSPQSSHPLNKALIRESGSLSPTRSPRKLSSIGISSSHIPSARSLGSTSSGEMVSLTPMSQVLLHHDEKKQASEYNNDSSNGAWESSEPSKLSETNGETQESRRRMEKLEKRCKELNRQLNQSQKLVKDLQEAQTTKIDTATNGDDTEQLLRTFQEKEARLLQAAAEDHEQEMKTLRTKMESEIAEMQRQLVDERHGFESDRSQMQRMLSETTSRIESTEAQLLEERKQREKTVTQLEQKHMRALRLTEDKLAQSFAAVDDREEKIEQLKRTVKTLETKMKDHRVGAEEADEEIDELHNENEALHSQVEKLQSETESLRNKVARLEGDSEQLVHLKMELRLLKEDRDRATARVENMTASAQSNTSQLEAERDDALAAAQDLHLQLSAALADLSVSRADTERVVMSNANLQAALEAFQSERETEISMIEEQRQNQESALEAAHKAAIQALKEVQLTEMKQIQAAADGAVQNSMEEIKSLEEKVEMMRKENIQTRRALDEAIGRLQVTQDDVVDRTFMKNILLDWLTKSGKKERSQVLQVMADLLHFTDDEKQRVNVGERSGSVRHLMTPPPPKADLNSLEGENVREKWVNFLIAEAED